MDKLFAGTEILSHYCTYSNKCIISTLQFWVSGFSGFDSSDEILNEIFKPKLQT